MLPKDHAAPSVFLPEHLLREARRQRGLPETDVPRQCVLDPDGDLVRYLRRTGRSQPDPAWGCYHTEMDRFSLSNGAVAGVVGCAVGAPFAVLVAEQLFASGCQFLLSVTSSGRIAELEDTSSLVLIDRALRDEGTSVHYLASGAGPFVAAPDIALLDRVEDALCSAFPPGSAVALHRGATWTTDAPYRETEAAIAAARAAGVLAVEMEAAALYAFAGLRGMPVVCLAHVTNTMGHKGKNFEKGEAEGAVMALRAVEAAMTAFSVSAGERAAAS